MIAFPYYFYELRRSIYFFSQSFWSLNRHILKNNHLNRQKFCKYLNLKIAYGQLAYLDLKIYWFSILERQMCGWCDYNPAIKHYAVIMPVYFVTSSISLVWIWIKQAHNMIEIFIRWRLNIKQILTYQREHKYFKKKRFKLWETMLNAINERVFLFAW